MPPKIKFSDLRIAHHNLLLLEKEVGGVRLRRDVRRSWFAECALLVAHRREIIDRVSDSILKIVGSTVSREDRI